MTDAVCWAWEVSPEYRFVRFTKPVPKRGHTKGIRLTLPRDTSGAYLYICTRCGVVFSETEERDGS